MVDQPIATIAILINNSDVQAAAVGILYLRDEVAADVVKEGLSAGHQVLQITHLRAVDSRLVDLTQNPPGHREPERLEEYAVPTASFAPRVQRGASQALQTPWASARLLPSIALAMCRFRLAWAKGLSSERATSLPHSTARR
jgi:hypothetical protein